MIDRQIRSSNRTTDTIASFLLKTFEILEHPQNKRMISWDKDDIGFIVTDPIAFTREILPKYFRHCNFSSFVRQLNMYDFHKVKQQNDSLVFKNPLFCRGEQQKLRFIKRKAAKKLSNHQRRESHDKNHENEKYESSLKWLRKSLELEINQSCIFFEKSIELIKQNNEANKIKESLIHMIKTSDPGRCLDLLFSLREDCHRQISVTERWLEEHYEIYRRKIKNINSFNTQLNQTRRESIHVPSIREVEMPSAIVIPAANRD